MTGSLHACMHALQVRAPSGRPIWSGLRVRMGMAYGFISSKKPLNTGDTYSFVIFVPACWHTLFIFSCQHVGFAIVPSPTLKCGCMFRVWLHVQGEVSIFSAPRLTCMLTCAGRADYFGVLANTAARVAALAAPGQV